MENIKKKAGRGTTSREQWHKHIEAWRASGGSQSAYCRKHGLAGSTFRYWKHQLERESLSGFVEVSPPVRRPGGVIDILIDERIRVRVGEDVGAEQLRTVMRTILEL